MNLEGTPRKEKGETRTLYFGFGSELFVDVARALHEERGIIPVYWTARSEVRKPLRRTFPEAVFHDRFDGVRGIPPRELSSLSPGPLDRSVLLQFSPVETSVLQMMDRMDGGDTFPYSRRIGLYHRQLAFWQAALRQFSPDLLLFFSAPHFVYDYVAYNVAKHLGIRTRLLRHTALPGLSYAGDSIECGHDQVRRTYHALLRTATVDNVVLSSANERYLKRLQRKYDEAEPDYMKKQREGGHVLVTDAVQPRALPNASRLLSRTWRASLGLIQRRRAHTVLVSGGRDVRHYTTTREYAALKVASILKQRRLLRFYRRLAVVPDLERPYVFLGLHFQPERTTSPDAGAFTHQRLIASQLSRLLPPGWMLYIKEHPTQYVSEIQFDSLSAQQRSVEFYEDIASHKNVEFVPLDYDPFVLIERARAVATATGTVGWEAVVRRRPVLSFGYPWYLGCDGVFHVMDENELVSALRSIVEGFEVDPLKTRVFVKALEQCGFVRQSLDDLPSVPRDSKSPLPRARVDGIAAGL